MGRWHPFDEEEARLALALIEGIGGKLAQRMLQRFGSATAIFSAPEDEIRSIEGIGQTLAQRLLAGPAKSAIQAMIQRIQRASIWQVAICDPDYPSQLLQLSSPPFLLYGRGERKHLRSMRGVAVVGTREANAHGVRLTQECVAALCRHGYTVISGGARGVDACAHREALRLGGKTWALLGCGVDVAYPPEHDALFSEIAAKEGLLLSEFPPGERPEKGYFPRRNRLIAALSEAVVVVQCSLKSGALNTAEVAQELQRPIATYPGRPQEPLAGGPHRLLREGAWLIESGEELCERLAAEGHAEAPTQLVLWEAPSEIRQTATPTRPTPPPVGSRLRHLWENIPQEPRHIDDIAQAMGESIQSVSAQLVELELAGHVVSYAGMRYSKT